MGSLQLHQPPIPAVLPRDRAELIARRRALDAALDWHLTVVDRLLALADRIDGDPDLKEDEREGEHSGFDLDDEASQTLALRGGSGL